MTGDCNVSTDIPRAPSPTTHRLGSRPSVLGIDVVDVVLLVVHLIIVFDLRAYGSRIWTTGYQGITIPCLVENVIINTLSYKGRFQDHRLENNVPGR